MSQNDDLMSVLITFPTLALLFFFQVASCHAFPGRAPALELTPSASPAHTTLQQSHLSQTFTLRCPPLSLSTPLISPQGTTVLQTPWLHYIPETRVLRSSPSPNRKAGAGPVSGSWHDTVLLAIHQRLSISPAGAPGTLGARAAEHPDQQPAPCPVEGRPPRPA